MAQRQYSQDEIDAVAKLLNAGKVTADQISQQYGFSVDAVNAELEAYNNFKDLTSDTLSASIPELPTAFEVQAQSGPVGTITATSPRIPTIPQDQLFDAGLPAIPDSEGVSERADTQRVVFSDIISSIQSSGATEAEMIAATADLLRQTGLSAHAVAQVTDIPLTDIQNALASQGFTSSGVYDPNSTQHPSFNPTGVGPGFNEDGLTAINIPNVVSGSSPSSTGDIGGIEDLIKAVFGDPDVIDAGNTETEVGTAAPSNPGMIDVARGDLIPGVDFPDSPVYEPTTPNPAVQEHPWRYDGNGTFTNILTGETGTTDIPDGVVFTEGEQYSVGDEGSVFNSTGDQVAQVAQNDQGVDVLVVPNVSTGGGNVDSNSGSGTGGTGSGSSGNTGGGSSTPTGGTTVGGTVAGPAGSDGADGEDGVDGTNALAILQQPAATPIVDGMFADYAPTFRRHISRNLLNPNFRS